MNNVEYLTENIEQVRILIADTEKRMSAGEEWLDAQLETLKRHLKDLHRQLAKISPLELVG